MNSKNKEAWLTIDDCPSPDFSSKMAWLSVQKVPALLFCEGQKLLDRPQLVIEAIEHGFVIGNHSFDHPHFSDLSLDQCIDQIKRTDEIINNLYEQSSRSRVVKYFRFPFFDRGGHDNRQDYHAGVAPSNLAKQQSIQEFLLGIGYRQPNFQGITRKEFYDSGDANYCDVRCTFNQEEYWLGNSAAPAGLDRPEAILALMEEDAPEYGRNLNDPSSRDIILIHDHEMTTDLFFKILKRYLAKGIHFLPIP